MLASVRTRLPDSLSILLVCHSYPPIIGGSEIEAQRVCSALRARGHQIEVLCCGGPPMPPNGDWVDPLGTQISSFAWQGRTGAYAFALGVLSRLWTRRKTYKIVYFLMPGLHVALAVPFAAWLGKSIVMKFSGSNEVRKLLHSQIGRSELASLALHAHSILLLNEGMFEEAGQAGLPASKLVWMPNPVDMDLFSPVSPAQKASLRHSLGLPASGHLMCFAGRLAPEKCLPTLLEAFALVLASEPKARLLIVGDGPERKALDTLAASLGIDSSIHFTGRAEPNQIPGFMQASDSFALLSALEGFPVALLEAMAAGLPPIVSDIPANRQLISEGSSGYIVPLNNPVSTAKAWVDLIRQPATAMQFGATAREHVKDKYSLEQVALRYEQLFDPQAAGPAGGSSTLA